MILRPFGVVVRGHLELGLEVEVVDGVVVSMGPQTGMPDPYVLSAAFVNAHSHFEYRGMAGSIEEDEYIGWIRAITAFKTKQTADEVMADCLIAAEENVASGIAFVAEHSDRPGSAAAMSASDLRGMIFQEVITFLEAQAPAEKLAAVSARAEAARTEFSGPVYMNPHAPHTVDSATFGNLAKAGTPLSIHVAETVHERAFWESDSGPLAESYRRFSLARPFSGRLLDYLDLQGAMRPGVQLVHMADADRADIAQMAATGVSVAHCPRSNESLKCPKAPVREMLDAGVLVGLGLDSAASSGLPDMFAEMRSALSVSFARARPLSGEEVWWMATGMGAASLGVSGWEIERGSSVPLIALDLAGCLTTEELIERGGPESVLWRIASG